MTSKPKRVKKTTPIMRPADVACKTPVINVDAFREALLTWYDRHRRVLPWRTGKGETADPYHVWLSEIMLQQTVVAAVIPYFVKFVDKWPTVRDLAAADQNEVMEAWAGLGYYSRARNLHKCAQIIATEREGQFPQEQAFLKELPGIGDYTSAAIAAIAFGKPATVIDGNVDRVISRYFALTDPLPGVKPQIKRRAAMLAEGRTDRPGDFAQATMDLGATICTPKSPKCVLCPIRDGCQGYAEGLQEALPYKLAKSAKPKKYGYIYWITNDRGQILLERRGERGLLAGTLGLPTSRWEADRGALAHPAYLPDDLPQTGKGIRIFHSFTHFDLELEGQLIEMKGSRTFESAPWKWVEGKDIKQAGLPTVFKKFVNLMVQNDGN